MPSRNGNLNQLDGQSRSFGTMAAFGAMAAFAAGMAAAANEDAASSLARPDSFLIGSVITLHEISLYSAINF